jgi:hypothetical protein
LIAITAPEKTWIATEQSQDTKQPISPSTHLHIKTQHMQISGSVQI